MFLHPKRSERLFVFFFYMLLGCLVFGKKILNGEELYFQTIRDPNPWIVSYPWRELIRESFFDGVFPLWNPYNALGAPFVANYQSAVFSFLRYPFYFLPFSAVVAPFLLFQLCVAGFGTYLFMRAINTGLYPSIFSGCLFMLCGYLVQYLNDQHIVIDLLLPYGLLSVYKLELKRTRGWFLALFSVMSLIVLGGQPASALFSIFFLLVFQFFLVLLRGNSMSSILLFLFALTLALILSSIQLLPFFEYISNAWTFHYPGFARQRLELKYIASIIAPGFLGKTNELKFPIQQVFPYLGGISCLFFFCAMISLKYLRGLSSLFGIIVVICLGILFYVPPFSLLTLVPFLDRLSFFKYLEPVASLSAVIMAGIAFEALEARKISVSILVQSALICSFILFLSYVSLKGELSKMPMLSASLFFVALVFLVIFLFSLIKKSPELGKIAIIFLASFELLVSHHLVNRASSLNIVLSRVDRDYFNKISFLVRGERISAEPFVWLPSQAIIFKLSDLGITDALVPKRFYKIFFYLNNYQSEQEAIEDYLAFHSLFFKEEAFEKPLSRILKAGYYLKRFSPQCLKRDDLLSLVNEEDKKTEIKAFKINGEPRMVIFAHPPKRIAISKKGQFFEQGFRIGFQIDPSRWQTRNDGVFFQVLSGTPSKIFLARFINPSRRVQERKWLDFQLIGADSSTISKDIQMISLPGESPENDWAGWSFVKKDGGENGFWLKPEKKAGDDFNFFTALYGEPLFFKSLPCSLARIFFPQKVIFVRSKEQSFQKLIEISDVENETVVQGENEIKLSLGMLEGPKITDFRFLSQKVVFEYEAKEPCFAVISQQYFPGWRAYLNQKEIRIYPSDYILQGVFLKQGRNQLIIRYKPYGFRLGLYLLFSTIFALFFFIRLR